MKSGFYEVVCLPTNTVYVGEAEDVFNRLEQHKRNLKNGKHHCKALQHDWNACKDNKKDFLFLPVHLDKYLYENKKDRVKLEVKYIQHLTVVDKSFVYNKKQNIVQKDSHSEWVVSMLSREETEVLMEMINTKNSLSGDATSSPPGDYDDDPLSRRRVSEAISDLIRHYKKDFPPEIREDSSSTEGRNQTAID